MFKQLKEKRNIQIVCIYVLFLHTRLASQEAAASSCSARAVQGRGQAPSGFSAKLWWTLHLLKGRACSHLVKTDSCTHQRSVLVDFEQQAETPAILQADQDIHQSSEINLFQYSDFRMSVVTHIRLSLLLKNDQSSPTSLSHGVSEIPKPKWRSHVWRINSQQGR